MDLETSGLIEQYDNFADYAEPVRSSLARAAARKAIAAKAAAQAPSTTPVGFELQPKPAQPEAARPVVPMATHPATRTAENR